MFDENIYYNFLLAEETELKSLIAEIPAESASYRKRLEATLKEVQDELEDYALHGDSI